MRIRNLKPGESPRAALYADLEDLLKKSKAGNASFEKIELATMALAFATMYAWLEKVGDYKMPLLAEEINKRADEVMEQWGFTQDAE